MIKTILILILTLIVVPLFSYNFDAPLTAQQSAILWQCVYICIGVALACFALSQLTGNCSQVDKIWSIVPLVYAWYITYASGWNERLVLMSVLVTLWGLRLTYNFSRRGAYTWKFWSGEEDYRWGILREKPELKGKVRWFFFNLFFISLYQNGLILLFTLPVLFALKSAEMPIGGWDIAASALFLFFLILETVADQQQWNYQTEKYKRIRAGVEPEGIYAKGFTHHGLWKYMRHPNYMAEQAQWICFYLLAAGAAGQWLNWSVAGCLLLLVLFQGSSDFSEAISTGKYPEYAAYKKSTGRFLPKLPLKQIQ